MPFWKRRDYHQEFDEGYARRPVHERREGPQLWIHVAVQLLLLATVLGAVWGISGRPMLEKTLKELVSPLGLAWLVLGCGIWFSLALRNGLAAVWMLIVWILLTAGGNKFVADGLSQSLERPWLGFADPARPTAGGSPNSASSAPFDLVIVLGGGTGIDPALQPQLNAAGDRVMRAARMFHAGQTRRICVTGEQTFRSRVEDPDPAEEARDLLVSVGVPSESIVALRGQNTSREIECVREWLGRQSGSENWKMGLLTSAWHLTRAMRLAQNAGLEKMEPLPSCFMTQPFAPEPSIVIPTAHKLEITGRMLNEYLGRWLGR